MSDRNPTQLILRPVPMQHDIKRYQYPRQPRRLERQQSQEAQPHVGIPSTPYIHQRRAERRAEKRLIGNRSDGEQAEHGIGHEPGEVGDGGGGLLEHARVALDEEDVEEEVEGEGAEVDEGGEEAPVLLRFVSVCLLAVLDTRRMMCTCCLWKTARKL